MRFYDDKTEGVIRSDSFLIIQKVEEEESITFKASFVVTENINCNGKITALFDLYVLGNIEACEIDVKGRLFCLGVCEIEKAILVQNDIWANDIRTESVVCHDKVVVQGIDVCKLNVDGSIIVGKTLIIENEARSMQNVICGETAFGSGKLIAKMIMTAEPLDLDDGEDALENPFVFNPKSGSDEIIVEMAKFALKNDYQGYFDILFKNPDEKMQRKLKQYKKVFATMYTSYPNSIGEFRDVSLLIWLIEIAQSDYLAFWPKVNEWVSAIQTHFDNLIHGKTSVETEIRSATNLKKGYVVSHTKFGRGIVISTDDEENLQYATIFFDENGEKKFPIPDGLKFFKIISEKSREIIEETKESITCNIDNYEDWLNSLMIINSNKEIIGDDLYDVIYDKLLSKIGLKAKFIRDRLKEKGW